MHKPPRLRIIGLTVGACLLSQPAAARAQDDTAQAPTTQAPTEQAPAAADSSDSLDAALQSIPRDRIARVRGGTSTQTHTVRRGDTLWGISGQHLRDPYLWPAVWAQNPQISNPHWIFPGDVVYLRHGGRDPNDPYGLSSQAGMTVLQAGYYTEEDIKDAGRVLFSPEEKTLLTLTDEAYVNWKDEDQRKAATPGRRYAIYRKMKPAVDRASGDPIAQKLRFAGTLDIIYNDGQSLPTGVITNAYMEIERGDLLLPAESELTRTSSTPNAVDVDGRIMDVFEILTQVGEQQYVLLDRGAEDGVQVGNRFMVFEQREGLRHLDPREPSDEEKEERKRARERETPEEKAARERAERQWENPEARTWPLGSPPRAKPPLGMTEADLEDDPFFHSERYAIADLPRRLIGEVLVIQVNKRFSTGLVTQSAREINLNHPVRMLRGY
jgi:hypothetical protein